MSAGGCMCYIDLPDGGLSSSLVPGAVDLSSGLWGFMSWGGCRFYIPTGRGSLILLGALRLHVGTRLYVLYTLTRRGSLILLGPGGCQSLLGALRLHVHGRLCYIHLPGGSLSSSLVPGAVAPSSGLWGFMSTGGCVIYTYQAGASHPPWSRGLWLPPRGSEASCPREAVCVVYTYQAGVSHPPWSRGLWLPPRGSEASCPREAVCVIYTYQAGVSHPPWSRGLWLPPRGFEASCPWEAVCVTYTYQAGFSHPPWSRGLWIPPRGSEASCPREVGPCAAASRREAEYPRPRPASHCRHLNQRKSELPVNNTLGCPSTSSTGFISHSAVDGVYSGFLIKLPAHLQPCVCFCFCSSERISVHVVTTRDPLKKFPEFSSISGVFPWLFLKAQKQKFNVFITSN